MPPCTEYEPHNIFNEDILQSTSFIDLLQKSSDVNMSCYMSDEEPIALPMLSSTSELSPLGGSVNLLDIIDQNLMLGNNTQSTTTIASTEVTYMAQSTAPSAAPFTTVADMFLPVTTATCTFRKPMQTFSSTNEFAKTISNLTSSAYRSVNSPATSQSTNPFLVNPFVSHEKQFARNPVASTSRIDNEQVRKTDKASFNSTSKSKSKPRGGKSSSNSKSNKKTSGNFKMQSIYDEPLQKSHVLASTQGRSLLKHTVTKMANIATERSAVLNTTTLPQTYSCTVTTSATMSSEATSALGIITSSECTSIQTTYTITKGVTSIISPMRNTYVSKNASYSTPVISRTPAAASSPSTSRVEQFAILPVDSITSQTDGLSRLRSRLVMPLSLNAYTTSAATVNTTTASYPSNRRIVHTVRPFLAANSASYAPTTQTRHNTSSILSQTLTHNTFALRSGTLYAARKFIKPEGAVTTEPRSFAIADEDGTYTLTISSGFTTTASIPIVMTETENTISVTAGVTNMSTVASDTIVRSRNQILPLPNSPMNTSTSRSYLVNDMITFPGTAAAPSTEGTTTITSHTIKTISSEALNRIRNRLIYNVPSTTAGQATDGNRSRRQVTIIANQLISPGNPRQSTDAPSAVGAVPPDPRAIISGASQGSFALNTPITSSVFSTTPVEYSTRHINRMVMPTNLQATSTLSSHSVTSPGTYIIAGVGSSPPNTGDAVAKPPRVIIPFISNTSAATTTTILYPAAASGSTYNAPSDMYSRLRKRLTAESSMPETTTPITTYMVSRTHTPQSIYTVPPESIPYISTKNSEVPRNTAAMTLVKFAPPSTVEGVPHRCPATPRTDIPSPVPTISTTGNRFVIKLSTGQNAANYPSATMTTSITTPITSTTVNPAHQFAPHTQFSPPRTFPGPRAALSVALRNTTPVLQLPVTHVNKTISAPAPLQIFPDVVCPKTTIQITTATQGSNIRYTLCQGPGRSTMIVPHYKNPVFKCLPSVEDLESERACLRSMRSTLLERSLSKRSVALVSPRQAAVSPSQRSTVDSTETSVCDSLSSDESS